LGSAHRRRRTPLRPTQGSNSGSAPEDDELRFARPRARTRAMPRKTTNSTLPDPGLGLGLSPRRRRTPLHPTQGSDLGSAPEDDELRSARTPGLGLRPGLSRRSPPRPTQGLGLDLGHGRQTQPRLWRSLHITQPRAQTSHVNRRRHHHPTLSRLGPREQDRRPIWLAPPDRQ
jgi:hypothetical protein